MYLKLKAGYFFRNEG